ARRIDEGLSRHESSFPVQRRPHRRPNQACGNNGLSRPGDVPQSDRHSQSSTANLAWSNPDSTTMIVGLNAGFAPWITTDGSLTLRPGFGNTQATAMSHSEALSRLTVREGRTT